MMFYIKKQKSAADLLPTAVNIIRMTNADIKACRNETKAVNQTQQYLQNNSAKSEFCQRVSYFDVGGWIWNNIVNRFRIVYVIKVT